MIIGGQYWCELMLGLIETAPEVNSIDQLVHLQEQIWVTGF